MKSEKALDQLLEATRQIDAPATDVLLAARNAVALEAQATAVRAAKIVQLRRRHRRLTAGVAAAAVAGLVAVPLLSHAGSTSPSPTAIPQITQHPPVVQEHFKTVAQVVGAAAAASGSANPADAPYWKLVTSWDCSGVPDASGKIQPPGSRCETTQWNGNGRPGVGGDLVFGYVQIPAATVTVDGKTMSWKEANDQTWTDAQIASTVADTGPSGNGRAPQGDYVFKNAIGLLTSMPASPTIRKQLWHELGAVDGAVLNGQVKDALGRTGWKITLNTPGWGSQWLIVDTNSGAVLEDGGRGAQPGVTGWVETIVFAGPSDTAPAAMTRAEISARKRDAQRVCGVARPQRSSTLASLTTTETMRVTKKQRDCMEAHLKNVPMASIGN